MLQNFAQFLSLFCKCVSYKHMMIGIYGPADKTFLLHFSQSLTQYLAGYDGIELFNSLNLIEPCISLSTITRCHLLPSTADAAVIGHQGSCILTAPDNSLLR